MKVLMCVVDKLPDNCQSNCNFNRGGLHCEALSSMGVPCRLNVHMRSQERLPECPLVTKEECKKILEYEKENKNEGIN